jgi:hypothetical protein
MRKIEPEMIQLKVIVNKKFGLDLNTNTRKRDFVNARLVYSKILRERGYTHEAIGRSLNRDHATIIYYCRCASNIFMQDRFLEKKYFECKALFFADIQPIETSDAEDTLAEQLDTLKEKVYGLTAENKLLLSDLNDKVKKTKRINKIINLIEERTHYGKEELVEKKIREMFNGLTQ